MKFYGVTIHYETLSAVLSQGTIYIVYKMNLGGIRLEF